MRTDWLLKNSTGWILVYLVLSMGLAKPVSAAVLWDSSSGGNNHLYELVLVGNQLSWDDARTAAQSIGPGWDLVTITSAAEDSFVRGLFATDPAVFNSVQSGTNRSGPWIGAFDVFGTTNFQWVTGEAVTFTNWGPSEPFGNGQTVAYADFSSPFGDGIGIAWNDIGPASRADGPIAYIAETVSASPLPPAIWLTISGLIGLVGIARKSF